MLLLAIALVPLSLAARQKLLLDAGGAPLVIALSFAVVGLVTAWHRPRNPTGWLMLSLAVGFMLYADGGLYDVIGYRLGHRLPLGPAVLILYHVSQPILGLLPLAILLFPDGRLPSRRWRLVVRGYLTLALADMMNWRRAAGERRQQLNWLMAGGAVALVSFVAAAFAGAAHGTWQVISDVLVVGLAALPAAIGVGILRYRLYEIERIISRTLSYAIVTGVLVGVYAGLVLLATEVLSVNSPVAVAASTLAAAALFTPVRRRVQRVADRRFNRVRYDGERTVQEFAARLKDAVDLDMVRADLAAVVSRALEPMHVSVWTDRG